MFTPRGSVHHFSNPHNGRARALIVLAPDIGPQYFRDVAAIVNAGGPPDPAKLIAVMSKYGLMLAPPQPTAVPNTYNAPGCQGKNVTDQEE
jgi:hypothetical protein